METAVRGENGWSASPQDIVEEDTRKRQEVRHSRQEDATDVRRNQVLGGGAQAASVEGGPAAQGGKENEEEHGDWGGRLAAHGHRLALG